MLKIGQKIKFSQFFPKNIVSGNVMERDIERTDGSTRRVPYRLRDVKLGDGRLEMSMHFIDREVTNGYYIGSCKNKRTRIYSTAERPEDTLRTETVLEEQPDGRFRPRTRLVRPTRSRGPNNRYSTNPRRMDDPRKLDEFALVKWGRKIVKVPIDNVLKHTYGWETKVI